MKLKRILAVILALCMVFSTMSFGAFAEGEGTDPAVQDFVITMYYETGFTAEYTYEAGTEGNLAEFIDEVFDDNFDGGLMGSIASIEIDINADMEITDPIVIPAGKTAVLDLNGHAMSYSTDVAGVAMITNKGDLTINGNGAIEYTYTGAVDGGKAANAIGNEGKLIIDGPAISNTTTTSTQIGYAVDNYPGAELTVKDGSLTVEGSVYYDAIRLFCNSDTADNVVVIEGGNVGTVWMQNPSDGSDSRNTKDTVLGSLTIKGGTVGKVYLEPCAAFDVAVEGGTIAGVYSNDTANSTSTSVPTGFITSGTISSLGDDSFLADGFELDESGSVVESAPAVTAVATVDGVGYTDIQEAIVAAAPAGTVEILADVVVDEWIMISETLHISSGQIITIPEINGLTINGNGHSLMVNAIESATNGNRLFYDATNLNVKDLTINYAEGVTGGIGLTSGTISGVTFNGGVGILPGDGDITITGCTFNTNGSAIYSEAERDNLVVTDNHFNTAAGQYAIYLRGNTTFTDNTVVSGKVNVVSGSPVVTGNDFGTERFKVYNGATATISNNTINNLVFNDSTETQATFTNNTLSEAAQSALDAVSPVTYEGSGTESDPYVIGNVEDLKWFRDEVNAGNDYAGQYFKLGADIDLAGENWTPIGTGTFDSAGDGKFTAGNIFKGNFDGGNYTISNLKINEPEMSCVGLFGYAQDATFKNIKIKNVDIKGYTSVAAVVAVPTNGCSISNCHVSGEISLVAEWAYVGGIASYGYVAVSNCSVIADTTGTIKSENRNAVGGIFGWLNENTAGITGCTVKNVDITGWANVGGIAGYVSYGNTVSGCSVENVNLNKTREDGIASIGLATGGWLYNANKTINYSNNNFENMTLNGQAVPNAGANILYGGEYYGKTTSNVNLENNTQVDITNNLKTVVKDATQLQAAIDAAGAGDVVTLLNDIEVAEVITINKSLTLDGAGKTLTYTGTNRAIDVPNTANGADVTIKNLTVVAESAERCLNYNTNGTFTVENVTVTGGSYAINFPSYADNATVSIKNSKLTALIPLNIWGSDMTIDVTDSELYSVDDSTQFDYSAIQLNRDEYGNVADGTTVTVTGGKLSAVNEKNEANIVVANWTATGNVTISDSTEVNGEVKAAVALCAGAGFYTLQDAFDEVVKYNYNAPIVLIRDIDLTESVTVPSGANIVLELNGKKIAGTDNTTKNYGLIDIYPGAQLTVNDTVGTGKITLTATNNRGWGSYSAVIANQRGKLTVNGGTIEHLGGTDMAYGIDNLTNGNGTYAETVINGGTVKSTYRAIRQFLNGTEAQNILTVNGGTIEGANKSIWMQDTNKSANTGSLTVSEDAVIKGDINLTVTAGSTEWPVEVAIAAAALEGESTVLTSNVPAHLELRFENGVYGVAEKNFAEVDGVKFTTLQAALDAAEGKTVILLEDLDLTATALVTKNTTLDLNGKKLSSATTTVVKVNGAELTIKDSVGNGEITTDKAGSAALFLTNGAKATLESGDLSAYTYAVAMGYGTVADTFIMDGGSVTGTDFGITAYQTIGGNVTINGGEVTATSQAAVALNKGTLEINGGTITLLSGDTGAVTTNGTHDDTSVTINGGTINGTGAGVYQPSAGTLTINGGNISGNIAVNVKSGSMKITGGNFTGKTGAALVIENVGNGGYEAITSVSVEGGVFTSVGDKAVDSINAGAEAVTGFIKGGYFDQDPTAYVADGYKVASNANNTLYSVSAARELIVVAPPEVKTGEEFKVEVSIDTADIKGVKWTLEYDENQFELVSFTYDTTKYTNYATDTAPDLIAAMGSGNTIDTTVPVATYTFKTTQKPSVTESELNFSGIAMQTEIESIKEIIVPVDDTKANIKIAVDYVVEVALEEYNDYVAGTKLVLVYTNSDLTFDFNGVQMFDVTGAGYKYEGQKEYAHVYALVVEALSDNTLDAYEAKVTVDYTGTAPTVTYDKNYNYLAKMHDNDVNISGAVNWNDIISVYAVAERNEYAFRDAMNVVLKADVNGDKVVDTQDASPIINEVYGR